MTAVIPVIYGEVLFDEFEDGNAVLGGAPFNVAWHLHGFGAHPLLVSRVGQDALGQQVLAAMDAWGMDVTGIQRDPAHATGSVQVVIVDGQPRFEICSDVAYDHITTDFIPAVAGQAGLLYHGSLSARSAVSRDTLTALRANHELPVFVDINLRPPWWSPAQADALMRGARWLKLNHEELGQLMSGNLTTVVSMEAAAESLRREYQLETVIVTRGGEGAFAATAQGIQRANPVVVDNLVDTVGAGDAFSAVSLFGLMNAWPLDETLNRASDFAAAVCRQQGATRHDPALYQRFREAWR